MKFAIYLILIFTRVTIFSVEYNTYKMEKVHDYVVGILKEGGGETLGVNNPGMSGPTPYGPGISYFDNSLHIMDIHRSRTIKVSEEDYLFEEILGYNLYLGLIYEMDGCLVRINNFEQTLSIYRDGKIAYLDLEELGDFRYISSFFYFNNTLFLHNKNNEINSITDPTIDWKDNRKKLTNEEDTIELINSGKFKGLTIDTENRLFLNGELRTLDYDTFLSYHREIQKRKGLERPKVNFTMQVKDFKTGSENLIGTDELGYTYWSSWNTDIAVFNPDGFLIELFVVNKEYIPTYPAVTSEGDIYFMHHDVDKVTLYKIKRQW